MRDDAWHAHPGVGLTPSRALAHLHAADAGDPRMLFELFNEMLTRWPRLAAVEATRRLALTGLDWEIAPAVDPAARDKAHAAPDAGDEAPAAGNQDSAAGRPDPRVADFCRMSLDRIPGLADALDHLARGLAFGISVVELVWESARLVDLIPVPHARLLADPDEPWRVRVLTHEEPRRGVDLEAQPGKWLVYRPIGTLGRPFEGGLLRASLTLYLAQNFSFKDWLIYSQVAGVPARVAQFESGISDREKRELLEMLERLSGDSAAVVRKGIDLKFIESRGGVKPYEPIQDHCNTEVTILWLGQHLTTDVRSSGSRAAAEVHDRVREDLLAHDLLLESRLIRHGLLAPIVAGRFGPRAAVPVFRRNLVQSIDTRSLADTLAVAVRDLGLPVSRRWAHQALGIPAPERGEPLLPAVAPARGTLEKEVIQ